MTYDFTITQRQLFSLMEDLGQYPTTVCSATSTATTLPTKAAYHHVACMIVIVAGDVLQASESVVMVWYSDLTGFKHSI